MYDRQSLAVTGVGFTLFGLHLSLGWIVLGAVLLILIGVIAWRLGTRGRRYQSPGA